VPNHGDVLECGGVPPLSDAAEENQNVVRLGISFPNSCFSRLELVSKRTLKSGRTLPHSKTWR